MLFRDIIAGFFLEDHTNHINTLQNAGTFNVKSGCIYRVSQEEISVFWEVTVSAILSKEIYMYMCPIPNGFIDRAISLYTVQTSNTPCPHTSFKVN
jgi:hypothetical protein